MAQALQITHASGSVETIPLTGDDLRIDARAGAKYRLFDDADPTARQDAIIRRIGDDLIIDVLAGDGDVRLVDYFFICELDFRGCAIELDSIGGAPGELLTPDGLSETPLADGSVLLWTSPPTAQASGAAAASAADPSDDSEGGAVLSWPVIAAGVGGLALIGAAAGGGGGGGDDTAVDADSGGSGSLSARSVAIEGASSNVPAPVDGQGNPTTGAGVTIAPGDLASGAQTNDTSPALRGTLDQPLAAGERLVIYRNGQEVGQADVTGTQWLFTDADVPAGEQIYTARVFNEAGERSPVSADFRLQIDGTAPQAPALDPVTGDDAISAAELAAGVGLRGTTEAGASVQATWGARTISTTADADGRFTMTFASIDSVAGLPDTIELTATDAFGNVSAATSRAIDLPVPADTDPPGRPSISAVDNAQNLVTIYSAENGVQVWGKAEAGATIRVTWGDSIVEGVVDRDGDYQVTFELVPVPNGISTITVVAIDAAGNESDARAERVTTLGVPDRMRTSPGGGRGGDDDDDDERDDGGQMTLLTASDVLEAPESESILTGDNATAVPMASAAGVPLTGDATGLAGAWLDANQIAGQSPLI